MAKRYNFLTDITDTSSVKLGTDGTFYTEIQSSGFESAIIVIAAYDSDDNIVTPTAGTATIEVSPIDGQWHSGATSGDNPIDLTQVGASADYTIPLFSGPMIQSRITLSGVTGTIDHFKSYCWRG